MYRHSLQARVSSYYATTKQAAMYQTYHQIDYREEEADEKVENRDVLYKVWCYISTNGIRQKNVVDKDV